MTQFNDREKAFESKFARDEEMMFKAMARRNKLLGLWAAEIMGMSDDEAQAYAKEVIKADFEEAGDEDVFRKVKGDLENHGADISDHRVRKAMADFLEEAKRQIFDEAS